VAESLFREARDLLDEGNVAAACPKFADSHRLDPAVGTALGLAMCREQEGKLASAWAGYSEAEALATQAGQADRRTFAREKGQQLATRLSKLTIEVPEELARIPSLEIRLDGILVGTSLFGQATPVDGGTHTVSASAPGKVEWSASVDVAVERAQAVVRVPPLADEAPPPPPPVTETTKPVTAALAPSVDQPIGAEPTFTGLQWAGITSGGVGVLAGASSAFFLSSALGHMSDSESDCAADTCGPTGAADRDEAVSDGNLATVFGITGVVLVGAGVTLFVLGDEPEGSPTARVRTTPLGLQLDTRF
jgi:hypothetical protein